LNIDALRAVAESLPPGTSVPVPREVLLSLLTPAATPTEEPDRLLTVQEAAVRLNVSEDWLYRRSRKLPFARHLSRKQLRFSEQGLQKWVNRR